jgi:hypothetical protein
MAHDAKLFNAHPPVEQANAFGWKLPLDQPADQPLFHMLLPSAQRIAANAAGLLGIDGGADKFNFFFDPYGGAAKGRVELHKLRSDCHPGARFLRQDVALLSTCKSGEPWSVALQVDGKNSKQIWQHSAAAGTLPDFQTSEDGRRFAVQTVGSDVQIVADNGPGEDDFQRGLMQVFDVDSGARVFATVLEPLYAVEHTAALSPDGMRLAVLRKGALEIYNLPPLPAQTSAPAMEEPSPKKKN